MGRLGEEHWVCFCTGVSSSPSGPTGDIVYLYTTKVKGAEKNKQKINNIAVGQSFSSKTGAFQNTITLLESVIIAETWDGGSDTSNTDAFNKRITQLRKWRTSGSNPIYMIIANGADSKNLSLSLTDGSVERDYIKGHIVDFEWEVRGNVYFINNLKFIECEN